MSHYGDHEATDDPLQTLRHSTAHLLAAAVTELYTDAKYGIGPPVEDGFYYDFQFGKPISESDLPAIESRMRRLAQADIPFVKEVVSRDEAIEEFRKRGQDFKLELIEDKVEGDEVSLYRTGDFLDLCRGPHVRSTKELKAFKLLRVAGAYWRGDEQLYHDTMDPPIHFEDGEELELRPMNCPHHIIVYGQELHSYRDLPVRIAELGQNYRLEKSGELMGMIRVRSFNLNDAHIFCTPDQVISEVRGAIELANHFMSVLGVKDYSYRLSVRDDVKTKWSGTDEEWETAEAMLKEALESLDLPYKIGVGDAAFYGPKIDFQVRDAHRREFTNNTVQVDYQLPKKFELEYVAVDGSRQRPVLVHRGAFGAFERMTAYLIEQYAGAFPTWLHPVQVVVIPITDAQHDYAHLVAERLRGLRLRVEVDDRSEKMQRKIRDWQAQKVPYMAIVGPLEVEAEHVNIRDRGGKQVDSTLESFASMVATEVAERRH